MPRRRALLFALALAVGSGAPARAAKPFPRPPVSYIYNEEVVSLPMEQELGRRLQLLEAATGRQFVAALFQSLDDESLEDYTNRLFRAWKIGDAKRNDGLLFCLFRKERRWRVEVGYGLEGTLTDLEAAEIVRTAGVPLFKAGRFDEGVSAVVDGLRAKLAGTAPAEGPKPAPPPRPTSPSLWNVLCWFLAAFYLVFWVSYERGFHWGMDDWTLGRRAQQPARYPARAFFILGVYLLFLLRHGFDFLGRASSGGGGGGGFSGGGGSSGGGGASGSW